MTRFVNKQLNTLGALLFCALASVLLQGCGAERTTPFDPDTSSSSSSSSVTKIDVNEEHSGTATQPSLDQKDKSLNVMRTEAEFDRITNYYVNVNLDPPSFTAGQVVLVDMGDTKGCDRHLNFSSLTAQEDGDSSIRVVVKYNEIAENKNDCSNDITRPYYFYYIDQRGPIIFEEKIL